MYKLDLTSYDVRVKGPDGKDFDKEFEVRNSFKLLLFHPALKITGRDLLFRNKLWLKIKGCKDDYLLIDSVHMKLLRDSCDRLDCFKESDIEFLERIYECDEVKNESD